GSNVVLPAEEAEELARIALASLEAEPVVYMWDSERKDIDAPGYYRTEHLVFAESSVKQWGGRVVPLYTAQPVPVTPDGWRSCSERMPAQDDWILIYSKHGEYMAGQVQGEYVELNDGTLSWLGNALYWMPLPDPPQEVK
ncbi:TPA: DUF551 domain-containing protein, partial [Escherichia coli]